MYKFLLVAAFLFMLHACRDKDDVLIETGVVGQVQYGEGDCMPVIDYSRRNYANYNGEIYFIVKSDLDNLGNGDFNQLKNKSLHVTVKNGGLSAEVPAGTYVVMPEDIYVYGLENTIIIKMGTALTQDFKFFKCTSY